MPVCRDRLKFGRAGKGKIMLTTVRAVVRSGRVEILEGIEIAEGTELLVTVLSNDEAEFWLESSRSTLASVWNNDEDDIYAELLKG